MMLSVHGTTTNQVVFIGGSVRIMVKNDIRISFCYSVMILANRLLFNYQYLNQYISSF